MSELPAPTMSALARPDEGAGVLALAMMSDADFETRLQHLQRGQDRLKRLHQALMVPDVDYGSIPGTGDKKTLFKSGAEKLCLFYSLRASFHVDLSYGDSIDTPGVTALVECRLHLGDLSGPVVALGYGAANTWETKHRRRRGERTCPECGVYGTIIKGKDQYGGGWLCFLRKGGCGAKFGDQDPAILGQMIGDVENPDQHDLANTVLKMAEKRSFVDATLRATATSGVYTQDLEDQPPAEAQSARENGNGGAPAGPTEAPASLQCSREGCGRAITRGQRDVSIRAHGAALCPACQKLQGRPSATQPTPAAPTAETPEQAIERLRKGYHPAFEAKFGRLPDPDRYAIEGVLCKWPHPLQAGSKENWTPAQWQAICDRLAACDAEDVRAAAQDLATRE